MSNQDETAEPKTTLEKISAELKLKTDIAENEKKIAEFNRDKLKAMLGASETKGLEGKIEQGSEGSYVAELAAYDAVGVKVNQIVKNLENSIKDSGSKETRILIVDDLDIANDDVLVIQIEKQITIFNIELAPQEKKNQGILDKKFPKKGPVRPQAIAATAAIAIPALLSNAAAIAGFFLSDYSIKNREISSIPNTVIQSMIAAKLNVDEVHIMNFQVIDSSSIIDALNTLIELGLELTLSSSLIKTHIIDSAKEGENTDEAKFAHTNSTILINLLNEFVTGIKTAPNAESKSALDRVIIRKHIKEKLEITHLLYLNIPSIGGESIAKRSLWSSGNMAYLGGGAITYILADTQGKIIASDTLPNLSYIKFQFGQVNAPKFKTNSG